MKLIIAFVTALLLLPVTATATVARAADGQNTKAAVSDVIARVGDQDITFSEINIALNSSAIVGLSIPALGTPQRDTVRITLLDKFISSNLLYLDALRQGADKDPAYTVPLQHFSNAILAGLYRQRDQVGKIKITEDEVQDYFKKNIVSGTEMNDDLHTQIVATLRRQKLHERMQKADKELRAGAKIKVYEDRIDSKNDKPPADDTVLAVVNGETITWGQAGDKLIAAGKGAVMVDPLAFDHQARLKALQHEIDMRILAQKARAAGLENDPTYQRRMKEFSKTLLINVYRDKLVKKMEPTEKVLKAYYEKNRRRFVLPEVRKIQMVVVKNEADAKQIMHRIKAGEITMFQAARDYSIAVNAKNDLGEVGWVNQGSTAPKLDKLIFSLEPGVLGGPVQSPAGWHLVKVEEVKDAKYTDYADEATHKLVRRHYLHDKLDAYTVGLREHQFTVKVYQDRLVQLAQQEADMVKALEKKAEKPGSITQKRLKELQKIMNKPPAPPM